MHCCMYNVLECLSCIAGHLSRQCLDCDSRSSRCIVFLLVILCYEPCFAIAWTLTHLMQVIVAGAPDTPETQALLAAAHGSFAPDRLVLPIDPANQASKLWYQQHNPEAWAMIEGATKEVCISLPSRVHFPPGQRAFVWAQG